MASDFYSVGEKAIRWNWGAFSNPVVFGVANRTYKTILAFLPCLIPCLTAILWIYNIIPLYVFLASLPLLFAWNVSCGLFAEKWVWATGQYEDGTTFRAVMDTWNRAGLMKFVVGIIYTVLFAAIVGIMVWFTQGDVLAALSVLFAS